MKSRRLTNTFFKRDVLTVAPELLGAYIVRKIDDKTYRYKICEVEAYRGEEDLACHASKGRTRRTEVMYHKGGVLYIYLIYGMYWMLNIVTGKENEPQAILIRGVEDCIGPGKVTKLLKIDKSFNNEDTSLSDRFWIEAADNTPKEFTTAPRVGIDYAGPVWKNKPWRFIVQS